MVDSGLSRRLAWLALCTSGCAAGAAPAPSAPVGTLRVSEEQVSAPARGRESSRFDAGFRSIEAIGQGLEFPLPDAQGWRRDPREKQSWVARHRQTTSTLVVRAWEHDDVARIEDCERQARAWRPNLPEAAPEEVLEQREQVLAGVYRARVVLFVRAAAPASGSALSGHALAFGSDARSCLMLAFSTAASGPRATDDVAERLAVVAQGVFGRARRVGIGERVTVPRL